MTFMVDRALTVKEQLIRAGGGSAEGWGGEDGKGGRRTRGVKVGKEGGLPTDRGRPVCATLGGGESYANALS